MSPSASSARCAAGEGMATTTGKPISLEAFWTLLDTSDERLELDPDGRVLVKPPVTIGHSYLTRRLAELLEARWPGGLALTETNIRWGARPAYRPEVAFWLDSRPLRDERGRLRYGERSDVPPSLAVEIRSPKQARAALEAKGAWYVAHGCLAALVVDPERRQVVALVAGSTDAATYDAGDARPMQLGALLAPLGLSAGDVFALLD
jgi:Uma2 family endonuclease